VEWAVWAAWTTKPNQIEVSKRPVRLCGRVFFVLPLNHSPPIIFALVLVIENEYYDQDESDLVCGFATPSPGVRSCLLEKEKSENALVMKKMILTLCVAALATSAIAADPPNSKGDKTAKSSGVKIESINTICPVSGDKVGELGKAVYVEYKGKKIGFCCKDCPKDFKKDPEKFAALAEKNQAQPGAESKK
jgi:YHS domain-containing protein